MDESIFRTIYITVRASRNEVTTIQTVATAYVCRFLTTTKEKGYSIKYFVACVFVSSLNVMWL